MPIEKKIIIFDLDGVLVNSLINMQYSWNKVKKKYKLHIPFSDYKKHIGLPFNDILKNLDINKFKKEIYLDYNLYSQKNLHKIKFYKNTKKIMKLLKKNYYLAVFTSKNRERCDLLLSDIGITFDAIITPQDVKKGKPNPEGIIKIKKKLNISNKNIYFIGDSIFDKIAAKKAKINFLFAVWGYTQNFGRSKKLFSLSEIFSHI